MGRQMENSRFKCRSTKLTILRITRTTLHFLDPTIPNYYERVGWQKIGMDEFKGYPVTVMETAL